jgi:hypothetical protein
MIEKYNFWRQAPKRKNIDVEIMSSREFIDRHDMKE